MWKLDERGFVQRVEIVRVLKLLRESSLLWSLIFLRYSFSLVFLYDIRKKPLENVTRAVTIETTRSRWSDETVGKRAKGERTKERRSKSEKVQKRRTEGRNKAEREAIPTAIVRKPCKDCGPISAPPCVREFISSSLLRSFSSSSQPRFLQ